MFLAVLYFHVIGGRPAMPVPSPDAISLLSLTYSAHFANLWGRHDPTCNHFISSSDKGKNEEATGRSAHRQHRGLAGQPTQGMGW
jgi:hypothetical protein